MYPLVGEEIPSRLILSTFPGEQGSAPRLCSLNAVNNHERPSRFAHEGSFDAVFLIKRANISTSGPILFAGD